MKINPDFDFDALLSYGFEKIDKEEEERRDQYVISSYDYKYNMGHARRGQFYYLLVDTQTRNVSIYATEPDGSGDDVDCPDVLIDLVADGVLVKS